MKKKNRLKGQKGFFKTLQEELLHILSLGCIKELLYDSPQK